MIDRGSSNRVAIKFMRKVGVGHSRSKPNNPVLVAMTTNISLGKIIYFYANQIKLISSIYLVLYFGKVIYLIL